MAERRVGSYELIEEIGSGAYGRVYRARHAPTGVERALKILSVDDREARARFQREIEALAKAGGHPHVIRIHESGSFGSSIFFAMELVEGGSLRAALDARPRLEPRRAATIVAAVARAIAHCHAAGILHRDLKPENILLDAAGEPKLADLGLARSLEASGLTRTGALPGTPRYMAPEIFDGAKATPASDVWALGCILFEALAGRQPFAGHALHEVAFSVGKGAPRVSSIEPSTPPELDALVARLLAREPAKRPDAASLAEELERFVAEGAKPAPRRRRSALLGAAAALAAAAGAVALIRPLHASKTATAVPAVAQPASATPTAAPQTASRDAGKHASALHALEHWIRTVEQRSDGDLTGAAFEGRGRQPLEAFFRMLDSFPPDAASNAAACARGDGLAERLLAALLRATSHVQRIAEWLDVQDPVDLTRVRNLPLSQGWRRAAILGMFARFQPREHPSWCLGLADLPAQAIDGAPAVRRVVYHGVRVQLLELSGASYAQRDPGTYRADLMAATEALVAAAAEALEADPDFKDHECAVNLDRAGEAFEHISDLRWSAEHRDDRDRARRYLALARALDERDPWRADLVLARMAFHDGDDARAFALAADVLHRNPADLGEDKAGEAHAVRLAAALRARDENVEKLLAEALKAERARPEERRFADIVYMDAILRARRGDVAGARAAIATAARLQSAGSLLTAFVTPVEQASAEVDAIERAARARR